MLETARTIAAEIAAVAGEQVLVRSLFKELVDVPETHSCVFVRGRLCVSSLDITHRKIPYM
jgi:hypothetical protein